MPKQGNVNEITRTDFQSLIQGEISAIIIKDFYKKSQCDEISQKINSIQKSDFKNGNLEHIGPFLMAHTTKKDEYFECVKKDKIKRQQVFSNETEPTTKIFSIFQKLFPEYFISTAKESKNELSPYIIRIHNKGKSIPIHKDNVKYEGKEYELSKIDSQLSCILHLQESEKGGELIIYDKNWRRSDEKFRKIDFGYEPEIISKSNFCRITNLKVGDLVIINPNYFHQVTKIEGESSRISLGMFVGIFKKQQQIVAWS
ncbi:2OG-Fe(II)-dependent halogenase WelO5 family protein [Nitrosopumilus sp. S6]